MRKLEGEQHQQILIQVDGLARRILEQMMEEGQTPHLAGLAGDGGGRLVSLYSGLPSTTPGAQGELFYGVRTAVPGFAYLEGRREARLMLEPTAAASVERRLEGVSEGLLAGGSCYCNIYTGGARITRFCPAGLARGWKPMSRGLRYRLRMLMGNVGVGVRSGLMLLGEVTRGLMMSRRERSGSLGEMVRSSWDRILMSVALRDSSRLGVLNDLREGVPVIHINFLGYDKQAHRYGPESAPAIRAMKGIDTAIGSIVSEVRGGSGGRSRTIVVYSDHGQESVTPIREVTGKTLGEIVLEGMRRCCGGSALSLDDAHGSDEAAEKGRSLLARVGDEILGTDAVEIGYEDGPGRAGVVVESGSIAHIYVSDERVMRRRVELGGFVASAIAGVAVMMRDEEGRIVVCWKDEEPVALGEFCGGLSGEHPFWERMEEDLERLAAHEDAGDLIAFGSVGGNPSVSFAEEWGAHGGIGAQETHAFAILERGMAAEQEEGDGSIRMEDLRRMILSDR